MENHRGERSGGHPGGGRGGGSKHHPYERHNSSRMTSRSSFSSYRDDDDYPNHQRQPFPRASGGGGGPPSGHNIYTANEDFPPYHGPVRGGGARHGSGFDDSPPLDYFSGHKRSSGTFYGPSGGFSRRGPSPDSADTGTFAKLFVGSLPRTAKEEDIRPLFEEHGNVLEVALIKDKRTGQQQGYCREVAEQDRYSEEEAGKSFPDWVIIRVHQQRSSYTTIVRSTNEFCPMDEASVLPMVL